MKKIALIGYAFRLPGATTENYWESLVAGKDLVTQVEADRWAHEAWLHPKKSHPGTSYTFAAGSLGDVSTFDAGFFGISPREAAQMDPQQRLLLEMSWEAFENAGVVPSAVKGSRCGVYIGIASADYSYRFAEDLGVVDSAVATGNTASIAANRISYLFDLRGPSMAIDTACSSSLVAFHQACRSIVSGESTLALAGGISLHLHPYGFITFSKASMLSPRGICNVFDASGDGYVRSEGGGMFLLKDYDRALADGDNILAVVAASVVNTDGRKSGLTVPSSRAQAALLREAYDLADIDPAEIDYIEAHGTGTAVGDPIETLALGEAIGRRRPAGKPLPIGSVKSNVGHLEAASGVAGLVKALHCLQYREVPATIHLEHPNPKILFGDWNLRVVQERMPLKASGRLVVGVNSFGFGGANAHVVLTTPPVVGARRLRHRAGRVLPVMVSGRSKGAVDAAASRVVTLLDRHKGFYELAYNLSLRREHHEFRTVTLATTGKAAGKALTAALGGGPAKGTVVSGSAIARASAPVFVYSGNGSQWEGMGQQLLAEPVFLAAVREVDRVFSRYADYSLEAELTGRNGDGRFARTEIAQPALFALQVGITSWLAAWGIRPAAVAGHSVGEVAAAWACGALTLEQAVQVIYQRSTQQGKTKGHGQMTAVHLGKEACQEIMDGAGLADCLTIAGVNSTRGITVAGDPADLTQLEAILAGRKSAARRLDLDYAFHSAAMDPIRAGVLRALKGLAPSSAALPFYSAVSGGKLPGTALVAKYWWQNIRQPVLFKQAIDCLLDDGFNVFVEIGPHAVLRGYVNDALRDRGVEGRVIPTLLRGDDAPQRLWETVGQLAVAGVPGMLASFFAEPAAHVRLPNYPWQRERHWHDVTSESLGLLQRTKVHPLLGYQLAQQELTWENQVDTQLLPDLADHVVGEATVFPGTGYAELALAAAQAWRHEECVEVADLEIRSPLLLDAEHSKAVRVAIDAADGAFTIRARPYSTDEPWTVHAAGRLPTEAAPALLAQVWPGAPERRPDFDAAAHLQLTIRAGLAYGPAFQAVRQGWVDAGTVRAVLQIPPTTVPEAPGHYHLHPALLDCTFQLIIHLLKDELEAHEGVAYVPTRIGRLICQRGSLTPHFVEARLQRRSPHSLTVDFSLFDESGSCLAVVHEARFRSIRLHRGQGDPIRHLGYRFLPQPHPATSKIVPAEFFGTLVEGLAAVMQGPVAASVGQRYCQEVEPLLDTLCDLFGSQTADPENVDELSAEDVWNGILADYPEYFRILLAVGRQGLLGSGERSAVGVGAWPALAELVLGSSLRLALAGALKAQIDHALGRLPAGQRLRILEIGSGEPILGAALCKGLDFDRCDYVLAIQGENGDACLRLQEHFPQVQVLEAVPKGAFDLVLALGDLGTENGSLPALVCAQSALADNGALVLVGIAPTRWADFVYSGEPGWWSAPQDGLQYSRHQPAGWWQRQLAAHGLAEIRLLECMPGMDTGPYLLLGRKAAAAPVVPIAAETATGGKTFVLVAGDDGREQILALELAERLALHGARLINAGAAVAAEDFAELFIDLQAEAGCIDGVIHLRGIGGRAGSFDQQLAAQVDRCAQAAAMIQACERTGTNARLWLMTASCRPFVERLGGLAASGADLEVAADAALWGFGRTLMNEASNYSVSLLDIGTGAPSEADAEAVAREILMPTSEQEVFLGVDGERLVPRLRPDHGTPPATARDDQATVSLGFQFAGQLRSLHWGSRPRSPVAAHQIEIAVEATGLNFRDVMYALGMLSDEAVENGFAGPSLGLECAGTVVGIGAGVDGFALGDRVVAFGPSCFGTRVLTSATATALMPDGISFESAATIPSTFFTAYYALHHLARLGEGEKVLIHGAAGGVGIAAIQIAKWCGAEIFATAGSPEKRDFLRLLGVEHILDSRSLAFADEIMTITDGQGVDVVLNSLAGEAINRNLAVLRPFGRFLELGKRDFYENTKLGLRPFRNNISYFGIDADQLMAAQPALTGRLFAEVMALFREGVLHPLPYSAFDADDVVDAFRHMQQARQIGKVVVTYRSGIAHVHGPRPTKQALQLPARGTVLVTGGLRGFGLRTAAWLAEKGIGNLVLVSRSGPVEKECLAALAELEGAGVKVLPIACDVTDEKALAAVLERVRRELPPLRGIVHAAMVIDDGLVRSLDRRRIERVLAPKVLGALHLHRLTSGMKLDFFVLYSSATTLFGNPGQASYVAANAWLEAFADYRRALGLPALCVSWGAIDDAGFLARNAEIKDALQGRMGGQALKAAVALTHLEALMVADRSGLGVLDLDWRALARFLPTAGSPKFSELARIGGDTEGDEDRSGDIQRLIEELTDAELDAAFVQMLKDEVGEILRIDPAKIDESRSIYDMGLDSLMGVELVTAVEARFGVRLPVMALSESPTIAKLAEKLKAQLIGVPGEGDAGGELKAQVEQMVSQHGAEVGAEAVAGYVQEIQGGAISEPTRLIR